jgi:hypothetical protein
VVVDVPRVLAEGEGFRIDVRDVLHAPEHGLSPPVCQAPRGEIRARAQDGSPSCNCLAPGRRVA